MNCETVSHQGAKLHDQQIRSDLCALCQTLQEGGVLERPGRRDEIWKGLNAQEP